MRYNKKFQEILKRLEHIDDEECQSLKAEIEILSEIYKKKDERLNKIIKISDKQQMAIVSLHEELDSYKNNLEEKVQEEIAKRKAQEDLLFEQTRLAMIAEMIDAVAHQWMQPLNILTMNTELLAIEAYKNNGADPKTIEKFKTTFTKQMDHLLSTLDNFRSFFRPIQEEQEFSLAKAIQSVLNLVDDDLVKYSIKVDFDAKDDFSINGNENEFRHIILNFISNSKYAFLEKKIEHRKIQIRLLGKEKKLEYSDNAGGIDPNVLETLFEMHTSTKGTKGTGIGLYMSQQIAHKHKGKLLAENIDNGAKFTFKIEEK